MANGNTNAQKIIGQIITSDATLTDSQRTMTDTKFLEKGTYIISAETFRPTGASPQSTILFDYSYISYNSGANTFSVGGHLGESTNGYSQGRVAFFVLSTSQNVQIYHAINNSGTYSSNFGSVTHTVSLIKIV